MAGRPATLKVDIVTNARGDGVDQTTSKLGKLGSIGKKVGIGVAAGLGMAGVAAGKFALDSIGAASKVQQSFGALDTIYGKNAARVKRWAAQAADSVGLAKSEYAGLAGLVGSQLQGMGMASDKSAAKSRDLIKMGADLAATYGGSVSDAVSAVSSLLKGESDPIERYAVNIKAADVSARMAALGLEGLTGKAEKQAKAQATLSLLTEQTARTQGAFAKESNTLAGQQERLGAKFENLKATLGEKLLPIATRVVTWASEKALPAFSKLGKFLGEKFGPSFAALGAWITGRLVPALVKLYGWFVDKIVPGLVKYAQPAVAGIKAAFDDVQAAVKRNEPQLRKLGDVLKTVAEFIANKVMPILGKFVGQGWEVLGTAIGVVVDTIGALTDGISWTIEKVKELIDWLGNIKVPDISLPGGDGEGWFSNRTLTTVHRTLVGDSPSYDRRSGWTSASAGGPGLTSSLRRITGLAGGGATVVDARTYLAVNVDGSGVVDEHKVAATIAAALARYFQRLGRPVTDWPAFAGIH